MTPARPPLFSPVAGRAGVAAMLISAGVVVAFAASRGASEIIHADGITFAAVALDLDGSHHGPGDNSFRYGRVGYPAVAWLASAGKASLLPWAFGFVNAAATGLVAACGVELAHRRGARPLHGLVVLAAPGVAYSLWVAWSEAMLTGLLLATYLLVLASRERLAAAVAAAAVLTKETALLALVPLLVDAARRRDVRLVVCRGAAVVPAALWWTWARVQTTEWPFLASSPSRALATGPPFGGLLDLLEDPTPTTPTTLVVLGTAVFLAVVVWWRARHDLIGQACLVFALATLLLGRQVLGWQGDMLRVLTPGLAFTLLGLAAPATSNTHDEPSELQPAPPFARLRARRSPTGS